MNYELLIFVDDFRSMIRAYTLMCDGIVKASPEELEAFLVMLDAMCSGVMDRVHKYKDESARFKARINRRKKKLENNGKKEE